MNDDEPRCSSVDQIANCRVWNKMASIINFYVEATQSKEKLILEMI